ncbi:MAG: hypothetical protein WB679_12345 [Terracidiphilus sp.]
MKTSIWSHAGARLAVLLTACLMCGTPASSEPLSHIIGTVVSLEADGVTIRTDSGEVLRVQVSATTRIEQIVPGQTDVGNVQALPASDLSIGDRLLVTVVEQQSADSVRRASRIVVMKRQDVVKEQQREGDDWRTRGVGGLVSSVDGQNGLIVLTTWRGGKRATFTVHITASTILKRYIPGSVRFIDAIPVELDKVCVGDQVIARGAVDTTNSTLEAEEVISGAFINVEATVVSVDLPNSRLVVKELGTKTQLTISITPDTQLRRLPEAAIRRLTTLLHSGTTSDGKEQSSSGTPYAAHQDLRESRIASQDATGSDPQTLINGATQIQLSALAKKEVVMIVATRGQSSELLAIKLISGIQSLLEDPELGHNLLSNWSLSGIAQ